MAVSHNAKVKPFSCARMNNFILKFQHKIFVLCYWRGPPGSSEGNFPINKQNKNVKILKSLKPVFFNSQNTLTHSHTIGPRMNYHELRTTQWHNYHTLSYTSTSSSIASMFHLFLLFFNFLSLFCFVLFCTEAVACSCMCSWTTSIHHVILPHFTTIQPQ